MEPQFISIAFKLWKPTVVTVTGDSWVHVRRREPPSGNHQKRSQCSHLLVLPGNLWLFFSLPLISGLDFRMDKSEPRFFSFGAGRWKWNDVHTAETSWADTVDIMLWTYDSMSMHIMQTRPGLALVSMGQSH